LSSGETALRNFRGIFIFCAIWIVLAVGAYFWATGMITSIDQYHSPLHENPPANEASNFAPPMTPKVVVILVDALRLDTSLNEQAMPVLASIRARGAYAEMTSQTPSYSAPGYSTLFSGAWPYLNDGPAFNKEYNQIPVWTQENIFSLAHKAGYRTAISGYNWFEKLVPQDSVAESFYTPGEDRVADEQVVAAAKGWITDPNLQFILIHIDQVDYAGHHEGGAQSQNWLDAATRADALIGELTTDFDYKRSTLVILSDHGQIDQGGHGGDDEDVLHEPFVIAGRGVKPGPGKAMQMIDVAPTLAALLGLPTPAIAQGTPQWDLLQSALSSQGMYDSLIANNSAKLNQAYADAIGQSTSVSGQGGVAALRESRMRNDQAARAIPAVLLLFGPIGWVWAHRKTSQQRMALICAVVYVTLFQIRFLAIDGLSYSFSIVDSPESLIGYIAVTLAICMAICTVIYHYLLRKESYSILEWLHRQADFIWLCLYLLFVPVVANWWMNGLVPTWTLPELRAYFTGLSFLIQFMVTVGVGIASLLITAGIAKIQGRPLQTVVEPASARKGKALKKGK
jgi:hypothetical protein